MNIVFKGVLAYGCTSAMCTTLWIMVGTNIHDRNMARQEEVVRARRQQGRDLA